MLRLRMKDSSRISFLVYGTLLHDIIALHVVGLHLEWQSGHPNRPICPFGVVDSTFCLCTICEIRRGSIDRHRVHFLRASVYL